MDTEEKMQFNRNDRGLAWLGRGCGGVHVPPLTPRGGTRSRAVTTRHDAGTRVSSCVRQIFTPLYPWGGHHTRPLTQLSKKPKHLFSVSWRKGKILRDFCANTRPSPALLCTLRPPLPKALSTPAHNAPTTSSSLSHTFLLLAPLEKGFVAESNPRRALYCLVLP